MKPQVIILAAGASSRFYPFNHQHKSLTLVCGKPILLWTLESIKKAGLKEVILVVEDKAIVETALGDQIPEGIKLEYAIQSDPIGGADAILKAKDKITGPFFVLNSQNYRFHNHSEKMIEAYESGNFSAILNKTKTNTPEKYGMLALDGDTVTDVIEKPSRDNSPSEWRIVGTYLFNPEFLEELERSATEAYGLEESLARVAKRNKVTSITSDSGDPTLKYPWDLFSLKDELLADFVSYISPEAFVAETAIIRGKVHIEAGAQIHDYAIIEGPAYIGKNSLVGQFSIIRNGTILEKEAQVERYCDVRNSLVGANSHIHSEFIGDSILGNNIRIGAGFITGNKRIDRANVKVKVKDQIVDTGQNNLGVFVGDNVKVGVKVATMPGTVLGNDSYIGPGLTIKGFFPDKSVVRKSNV